MKKVLLIPILLILSMGLSYSSEIIGEIFVGYDGISTINLLTENNIYNWEPEDGVIARQTSLLTSKEGEIWSFNFSPEGDFNVYVLNIYFPGDSEIIDIEGEHTIKIEGRRILISFVGNGIINAGVEYKVKKPTDYTTSFVTSIVILTALLIFLFFSSKRSNSVENLKYLSDTEKKIISVLKKNKKGIKQNELRKATQLPKATLSRTITNMNNKGIIEIDKAGITNVIRLK